MASSQNLEARANYLLRTAGETSVGGGDVQEGRDEVHQPLHVVSIKPVAGLKLPVVGDVGEGVKSVPSPAKLLID